MCLIYAFRDGFRISGKVQLICSEKKQSKTSCKANLYIYPFTANNSQAIGATLNCFTFQANSFTPPRMAILGTHTSIIFGLLGNIVSCLVYMAPL